MKTIPLTQGYSACIDDRDYAAITAIGKWCYAAGYAVHYYIDDEGRRKRLYMHRVIMQRVLGHAIPAGLQVDHINAHRLDNQRENLRLATRSQNQAAKGVQVNSTSGFKGVTYRQGRYDVRLRYYGERFSLGRYDSLEVAHAVYAHAHITLWGAFSSEYNPAKLSPRTKAKIEKKLEQGRAIDL